MDGLKEGDSGKGYHAPSANNRDKLAKLIAVLAPAHRRSYPKLFCLGNIDWRVALRGPQRCVAQ
jgi:hypothetical protein